MESSLTKPETPQNGPESSVIVPVSVDNCPECVRYSMESQMESPFSRNRQISSALQDLQPSQSNQRWAKPISNITNVTPFIDGRQFKGSHGEVQEGVWFNENGQAHKVAIKSAKGFSTNDAYEALRSEINILMEIPYHPNIIWVIGVRFGNDPIIVEEWMSTDLKNLLKEYAPGLTYRQILKICLDVVTGLDHLHAHNVVHYDLKPSNILLDASLNAKLADFTCSRQKMSSWISARMQGTLGYIAPECLAAGYCAGRLLCHAERIDVYSFGKVMLRCATGKEIPDPSHWCPEPVWQLIYECISDDPAERPLCKQIIETIRVMLTQGCRVHGWMHQKPKYMVSQDV